jgi:hypothetical protein
MARLRGAATVHVAAHAGLIPAAPLEAYFEVADGVITARELLAQRLEASVIVLSGCRTGASERSAGDELAGLAQACLFAGAQSLVVSLWSVNDPATELLMEAFHGARSLGADSARALLEAANKVQSQPQWRHPHYWGGFVFTCLVAHRRVVGAQCTTCWGFTRETWDEGMVEINLDQEAGRATVLKTVQPLTHDGLEAPGLLPPKAQPAILCAGWPSVRLIFLPFGCKIGCTTPQRQWVAEAKSPI